MDPREENFLCNYVDMSIRSADDMLYNCVQDPSKGYDFNCQNEPDLVDRKNTSYTDNLSHVRGFATSGQFSGPGGTGGFAGQTGGFKGSGGFAGQTEGFTNMFITDNGPGESTIRDGKCPEGYTRCPRTGRCIQVCTNCSYRDGMKSKEFNEADPCFPQGVYDGVTVDGDIKCTCGDDDKYCSNRFLNQFTADGSFSYNNKTKNTIGLTDSISKLFYVGQL